MTEVVGLPGDNDAWSMVDEEGTLPVGTTSSPSTSARRHVTAVTPSGGQPVLCW